MPEVKSPARVTAAMIRELRIAVKEKALSPSQFQQMVGAPHTPPVTVPLESLNETDRAAAIAKLEAWRADHPAT